MTIQEFKNVFGYLNPKFKKVVPSDYIITNEDIISGNLVQKYISSNSLTNIVNGFTVIDNEICYIYPKLNRIEILSDDIFPPCGGRIEILVYAIYDLHKVDSNGNDTIYKADNNSKVNAIVTIDNNAFEYIKPELIKEQPNNTDENIEVNVSATYYYKAVKYTCTKNIIQTINSISSWLLEGETTTGIKLTITPNEIGNDGGIATAKVEREFSRTYYLKDSCGNKVGGKNEPGHIEDITKKCIITSSNKKAFAVNGNIIKVAKQDVEASKRSSVITARFFGFESTATIEQAEGGKISHTYELSFDDGTQNKFVDLETSLKKNIVVPIISKEYKYIDGALDKVYNTKALNVVSESKWINAAVGENEDGVILSVYAIEANPDKENDREATITITNYNDSSVYIKLIISQSSLDVVNEKFFCNFYGGGSYTSEELDSADIYFKLFKSDEYEDGSINTYEYDELMPFIPSYASTNDDLLALAGINFINNKYVVDFLNLSKHSASDIDAKIKLLFNDKQIVCETGSITVKGNIIMDYDYELCFDNHNKFENIKWDNTKETKTININSLKHIMKNGVLVESEHIPFKVSFYDENGKERFDDSFSIKIDGSTLSIFPYKVSKTTSKTYIITQINTGLSISLKLDYLVNDKKTSIPLKVILYSKSIGYDLWTGEGGYLLVDGKDKIMLNPCWLSPNMVDNFDVAYNGNIDLSEGLHTFEAFNVLCLDNKAETHKEIKFKEEIIVNKATKNILLTMIV